MVNATCAALSCRSSSHASKELKFHQFPHDPERRKLWIIACRRSDVIDKDWDYFKHKYVCSLHFSRCMYTKKENLRKTAVPSINLSEKPLQHDNFTQTWESMLNVKPYQNIQENIVPEGNSQNDVSILYVQDILKNMYTKTTSTQTDDSIPFDSRHVYIKEEDKTPTKLTDLIVFEENAEIDKDVDSEEFEQEMEMKIEIVENEILTYLESTQALESVVPEKEIVEGDKTLCTQVTDEIPSVVNQTKISVGTNTDSTSTVPKKRKVEESIQTDRVMVFPIDSEESINPEDCTCERNNYAKMTRSQFYRCCSKFLSPNFCAIVRKQMYLDGLTKLFNK